MHKILLYIKSITNAEMYIFVFNFINDIDQKLLKAINTLYFTRTCTMQTKVGHLRPFFVITKGIAFIEMKYDHGQLFCILMITEITAENIPAFDYKILSKCLYRFCCLFNSVNV